MSSLCLALHQVRWLVGGGGSTSMSINGISVRRADPMPERMAELLQQLCAKEALSPEQTEAVVRRATCKPDVTPVEWPSDLVPHLRRFALQTAASAYTR